MAAKHADGEEVGTVNLFAGVVDLSALALAFVPDIVLMAFLFGVGVYIWNAVQEWCQQAQGPWRERLVLPVLFMLYWFLITYPIHSYLSRRWPGALAVLPWVFLAIGFAVYLSDLHCPRFWALFYGATELVFTLAERFGGRLLAGRQMFLVSNTLVWTLLVMVVTAAATGLLAFAVHFIVGLVLKLWERNNFFWAGSAGVLICVLVVGELWYHAPALAGTGFSQWVVPIACLLILIGFASGYAATQEYCYVPLLETAAEMGEEAAGISPRPDRSREAEGVLQSGKRQMEYRIQEVLTELQSHGFLVLSGVRVMGDQEAEIDYLLLGPNGFWVIDAAGVGPLGGAAGTRVLHVLRRAGANCRRGAGAEAKIQAVRVFMQRYIGDVAGQITCHYLACCWRGNQLAWSQGTGDSQVMSSDEVRAQILETPGTNPLSEEMRPRIMLLLLRETVDRIRRCLEEWQVRDVLPRLEPTKFEDLGLSLLASDEEIDRRFEELSRQYAVNGVTGQDEAFEQIRSAYVDLKKDRQGYEARLWQEAEATLQALRRIQGCCGG